MKAINLFLAILFVFVNISFGQISEIEKDLNQLFFEIGDSPSKYEVRKLFHGEENYHDFWEYDYGNYISISSNFKRNFKMSHLGTSEREIVFWFPNGSEHSNARKLRLEYSTDEFNKCQKQFEEILNIFEDPSHEKERMMIKNNQKEQSGEGWDFFSSEKSFIEEKPYLKFHYRYYDMTHTVPEKKRETGYILEIIYEEENLF